MARAPSGREGDAVGVAAEQADVGAVVGEDEFAAQVERDMRRVGAGVVEREHVGKVALEQEAVLFGGRQGRARRLGGLGAGRRLSGLVGAGGLCGSERVIELGLANGVANLIGQRLKLVKARFFERWPDLLDQRHQRGDFRRERVLADVVDEEVVLFPGKLNGVAEMLRRGLAPTLVERDGELLVVLVVGQSADKLAILRSMSSGSPCPTAALSAAMRST